MNVHETDWDRAVKVGEEVAEKAYPLIRASCTQMIGRGIYYDVVKVKVEGGTFSIAIARVQESPK